MPYRYNIIFNIPIKNEIENLPILIKKIKSLKQEYNIKIIFIDDNSNDGSVKYLKKVSKKEKYIFLRTRRLNSIFNQRGSALFEGLRIAAKLKKKYDFMIELDGDLSHDPLEVKKAIKMLKKKKYDVAIGSKYLEESKIINRSFFRNCLSLMCKYTFKVFFNLQIVDFTNGFRVYTQEVSKIILKNGVDNNGPLYLVETLLIMIKNNKKVFEFPSTYLGRSSGVSKLNINDFFVYFFQMLKLILFYEKKN